MYSVWDYVILYYFISSMSLTLRVFFQLFVTKDTITKTDFVVCIFWPVILWLMPLSFVRDVDKILTIRKQQQS